MKVHSHDQLIESFRCKMAGLIRGWLSRFDDRASVGGGLERFALGSINQKTVPLRLAHNASPQRTFAYATISSNEFGYKFEVHIPQASNPLALCRMIWGGCDGVSPRFRALASRSNGYVTTIEKAHLVEISIVERPAYKASRCWVVDESLRYAPPAIGALVEQWDTPRLEEQTTLDARIQNHCKMVGRPMPYAYASSASHDPVSAQVVKYMAGYMARCPR